MTSFDIFKVINKLYFEHQTPLAMLVGLGDASASNQALQQGCPSLSSLLTDIIPFWELLEPDQTGTTLNLFSLGVNAIDCSDLGDHLTLRI